MREQACVDGPRVRTNANRMHKKADRKARIGASAHWRWLLALVRVGVGLWGWRRLARVADYPMLYSVTLTYTVATITLLE